MFTTSHAKHESIGGISRALLLLQQYVCYVPVVLEYLPARKRTKSIDFSILWWYLKLCPALLRFRSVPFHSLCHPFATPGATLSAKATVPPSSYSMLRKLYIKLLASVFSDEFRDMMVLRRKFASTLSSLVNGFAPICCRKAYHYSKNDKPFYNK